MKCVVCGKDHDEHNCPICKFPKIVNLSEGNDEEALDAIREMVERKRKQFLKGLTMGIVTYHWKDDGGELKVEREELLTVGDGLSLYQGTAWCDQKFARVEDADFIPVQVTVKGDNFERVVELEIPNLREPGLQEVGLSIAGQCEMTASLRNASGSTTSTAKAVFMD